MTKYAGLSPASGAVRVIPSRITPFFRRLAYLLLDNPKFDVGNRNLLSEFVMLLY